MVHKSSNQRIKLVACQDSFSGRPNFSLLTKDLSSFYFPLDFIDTTDDTGKHTHVKRRINGRKCRGQDEIADALQKSLNCVFCRYAFNYSIKSAKILPLFLAIPFVNPKKVHKDIEKPLNRAHSPSAAYFYFRYFFSNFPRVPSIFSSASTKLM